MRMLANLSVSDEGFLALVNKFYGVLDGENVPPLGRVDLLDRQGRPFLIGLGMGGKPFVAVDIADLDLASRRDGQALTGKNAQNGSREGQVARHR